MAMAFSQRGYSVREDFLHLAFPLEEHDEQAWGRRLHLRSSSRSGSPAWRSVAGWFENPRATKVRKLRDSAAFRSMAIKRVGFPGRNPTQGATPSFPRRSSAGEGGGRVCQPLLNSVELESFREGHWPPGGFSGVQTGERSSRRSFTVRLSFVVTSVTTKIFLPSRITS